MGLNPVTATPPCINDDQAVAGGSTSGGAASVAFGLAPAAIGSDTGGSVRIPAAWNDLVGLKTSHGRLPLTGAVPLCETIRHRRPAGPFGRRLRAAAGRPRIPQARRPDRQQPDATPGFLVLNTVALDDLRPRPASGFEDALTRLSPCRRADHPADIPETAEAMALAGILFTAEAYGIWAKTIEAAPEKMFPRILERFRTGAAIKAADYVAAWRRLHDIRPDLGRQNRRI